MVFSSGESAVMIIRLILRLPPALRIPGCLLTVLAFSAGAIALGYWVSPWLGVIVQGGVLGVLSVLYQIWKETPREEPPEDRSGEDPPPPT